MPSFKESQTNRLSAELDATLVAETADDIVELIEENRPGFRPGAWLRPWKLATPDFSEATLEAALRIVARRNYVVIRHTDSGSLFAEVLPRERWDI